MVINSGKITGTLDARSATREQIGLLMTKSDAIPPEETDGKEIESLEK